MAFHGDGQWYDLQHVGRYGASEAGWIRNYFIQRILFYELE